MRKQLPFLTTLSLSIYVFMGCGGTAGNTNSPGATKAPETANTATAKSEEPSKSTLKPADITSNGVLNVIELANAASMDQAAWTGKEVTVSGYVWEGSGAAENIVTVTNDEKAVRTTTVSCQLEGKKPDGLEKKTVEFKGTVSYVTSYGDSKSVNLKPCELKK